EKDTRGERSAVSRTLCFAGAGGALQREAFFEVLEPSIQHFFDAAQLGAPEIAHVIEAFVERLKPDLELVEACVEIGDDEADHRQVEKHGNADREIEVFVGHHWKGASSGGIFS